MEFIRKLFSTSQRRRVRPIALSASVLSEVPIDILWCIMDLPAESAVAFSLSCIPLYCSLGTQHFTRVNTSSQNKLALLNRLALDLPNHIVCFSCERLHNMENLCRYNSSTYGAGSTVRQYDTLRLPACVSQDRKLGTWMVTTVYGTTAFKMAIKRSQNLPECTNLLDIMSRATPKTIKESIYVRQFREECRVVQGCLMHRLQSVHILRKNSTGPLFEHDQSFEIICQHTWLGVGGVKIESGVVRRCQNCRTEYRIDFKYYENHGSAVFFTRWKDLGPGPESEVWMQHIYQISSFETHRLNHGGASNLGHRGVSNGPKYWYSWRTSVWYFRRWSRCQVRLLANTEEH
jgi:hypothetical protein